jgi:hypothetical protein
MYKDLIWTKQFVMYCLSLIHAVSQAKCQKSYVLNTLVIQELIKICHRTLVPPK